MSDVAVTITGHLADTPEFRQTDSGRSVTNFTVISNARRFDQNTQQWVDAHTTAIRITAWGRLAEHLVGTIAVGHRVTVTGSRLTASAYIPRDGGQPRAGMELTADRIGIDLATQTATIARAPRTDTDVA